MSTGRKLFVVALIFAVAASAWQIKGYVQTLNSTAASAKESAAKLHVLTIRNRNLVTSLQSAIVESCRENGNARAEVQREQLHEEIAEAEHPDPQAFDALVNAGIPPKTIRELTHKTALRLEDRLDRIHLVNCVEQYQISPGSGQRRRDR